MSMHPIVSVCGTVTYNTAKFITQILCKYCAKTSSFVKDSTNFLQKSKHLIKHRRGNISLIWCSLHQHTRICCTASYQCQNVNLHLFHQYLKDPHKHSSSFWNSLYPTASSDSMRNSINNYWVQPWVHLSPLSLQIISWKTESLAIHTSLTLIKWWIRYDDVHSATRRDQVYKLQEHLNNIDPHIKFTIVLPGTDGLPLPICPEQTQSISIESSLQKTHPHRLVLKTTTLTTPSQQNYVTHTLIQRAE